MALYDKARTLLEGLSKLKDEEADLVAKVKAWENTPKTLLMQQQESVAQGFATPEMDSQDVALSLKVKSVSGLLPQLATLDDKTQSLLKRTQEGKSMSFQVTRAVRELDVAQRRTRECLAVVGVVIKSKECVNGISKAIQQANYEKAASFVHEFKELEKNGDLIDPQHKKTISQHQETLSKILEESLKVAVTKEDMANVRRFSLLFQSLDMEREGLQILLGLLEVQLKSQMESVTIVDHEDDASTDERLDSLSQCFNAAATLIQVYESVVNDIFVQTRGLAKLVWKVHDTCDDHTAKMLRSYLAHSRVKAILSKVLRRLQGPRDPDTLEGVAPRTAIDLPDLDAVLDEAALICQHAASYDRFIRGKASEASERSGHSDDSLPAESELNKAVQELADNYIILENALMVVSVEKAFELEEIERANNILRSVEDIFYVLKKCGERATATGHVHSTAAVFNHINNILVADLLEYLQGKLARMAPDLPQPKSQVTQQLSKLKVNMKNVQLDMNVNEVLQNMNLPRGFQMSNTWTADSPQQAPTLGSSSVILNSLEVCEAYCQGLARSLRKEIEEAFENEGDIKKLLSGLQNFEDSAGEARRLRKTGLDRLEQLLTPYLDKFLANLHGSNSLVNYRLTEDDLTNMEVNDPYVHRFVGEIESLLSTYKASLSASNFEELLIRIVMVVTHRLETVVLKKEFTQLGGVQLDKELRVIRACFQKVGKQGFQKNFARLGCIATLVNMDRVQDVYDYYSHSWEFSEAEVKTVLRRRVDFSSRDIENLSLSGN